MSDQGTLLYGELAPWFHLLTAPADYEEEAEVYSRIFLDRVEGGVRSVLEMGSGGGNSASHMKAWFEMTLTDMSPAMLEVSKTINPELQHIEGDMRTMRLDRTFDAVFVHDAASYLTRRRDMAAAIETAAYHLRPGGVALFMPDWVRERFTAKTSHGGHDDPTDSKGLRYLEWFHTPSATGDTYLVDYAYLLREGEDVRAVHDRHTCGAFPTELWLENLSKAGLNPATINLGPSTMAGSLGFIGKRPA